MLCRSCNNEMLIKKSCYEVDGDNSSDTVTRVFSRPYFYCVNKSCGEFDKEVKGEAVKLI